MRMRNRALYLNLVREIRSDSTNVSGVTIEIWNSGCHCCEKAKHSTMNTTDDAGTLETGQFIVGDIIFIFIAILIILFNGSVLSVMRKYKSLHNAQNGLLASLAVSDLSSGLIGIPLSFACSYVSVSLCGLCSVSYYFFKFISISTVLHILAIIGERCFLVVDPFLHRRFRATPGKTNLVIIATIWLTSLIASSVPWIWVAEMVTDCYSEGSEHQETWNPDSIYELVCFILFFLIPLVLISIFLSKIFIAVRQFNRRKSERAGDDLRRQVQFRKTEMRIFLVLLFVFVLFVVCWLPYFAGTLAHFINFERQPKWLSESIDYSRNITSLLNPFVYAFYKDDVYQAMKRKLRSLSCWSKSAQSDVSTSRQKVNIPLVPLGKSGV